MWSIELDGYILGLVTAVITTYRHIGSSQVSYEDLSLIALINLDAAAFNVSAESDWEDLDSALQDIEANPNEYTVSGSAPGAAYHLAFAGFLNQQGIDSNTVSLAPSEGAAPGLQELVAGGVGFVFSSLPEAESMRDAERVRTLAVFANERLVAFSVIPTAEEVTGDEWAASTWRALIGPAGLPDDVVDTAEAVYESDQFQDFMTNQGFGMQRGGPEGFRDFMAKADENNGEIIDKLGLAE